MYNFLKRLYSWIIKLSPDVHKRMDHAIWNTKNEVDQIPPQREDGITNEVEPVEEEVPEATTEAEEVTEEVEEAAAEAEVETAEETAEEQKVEPEEATLESLLVISFCVFHL